MPSRANSGNSASWPGCRRSFIRWNGLPAGLKTNVFQRSKTTARIIADCGLWALGYGSASSPAFLDGFEGHAEFDAQHLEARLSGQVPGGGLLTQHGAGQGTPGRFQIAVTES